MENYKTYAVQKKLEKLVDIFSDLEKFGALNPLIYKVEKLGAEQNERLFRIYERPYRWLPITVKYKARVILQAAHNVEYQITELPFTTANFVYRFSKESVDRTMIELRIQINSKLIGKKILMNKMIKAQDKIMSNLSRNDLIDVNK